MREGGGLNTETAGQAGENGRADAGNIQVNVSDSVAVSGGSQVLSNTFGEGNAGNVTIEGRDGVAPVVSFDGVALINGFSTSSRIGSTVGRDLLVGAVGDGTGGDITITARSLSLTNGARLDVSTLGEGNAGDIFVEVTDAVSLSNYSGISSTVGVGGIGNGGDIDIQARSLSLTGGSQVGAPVFREVGTFPGGQGQGGDIRITAADAVNISGVSSFELPDSVVDPFNPSEPLQTEGFSSGLFASTERGAIGPGGSITVTTGAFRIADGAVVDALTANSGNAGDITINANTFEATGGGQVLTTTRSSGRAGNITLNISDSLTLSGSDPTFAERSARFGEDIVNNQGPESGLFANTAPGSTGDGGSIFIDPIQLTITDGAGIAVDSLGTGNGGSLQVQAGSLTLDRDAFLSATTASGEGGDITLQVQDLLLLRRNSDISTEAGGTGNGGDIDIDAAFIVAVPSEDSNIIANAIEGQGGNIDITAQGIFGIQSREQLTSLSDITASSEVGIDGTVEINRPDVDPSQGLVTLPAELVDASNQIATGCAADAESLARNEFIITGRGGLPPNPTEPLSGEAVLTNWATLGPDVENRSSAEEIAPSSTRESMPNQIVEAQGWVIGANGEVVLTATAPTVTPHIPEMNSPTCHGSSSFHQQPLALVP